MPKNIEKCRLGGLKTINRKFYGKNKAEISQIMRTVRLKKHLAMKAKIENAYQTLLAEKNLNENNLTKTIYPP